MDDWVAPGDIGKKRRPTDRPNVQEEQQQGDRTIVGEDKMRSSRRMRKVVILFQLCGRVSERVEKSLLLSGHCHLGMMAKMARKLRRRGRR